MAQAKIKESFTVVSLHSHIANKYQGNNADFAKSAGMTRQGVAYLIKRGAMIGNGMIYTASRAIS